MSEGNNPKTDKKKGPSGKKCPNFLRKKKGDFSQLLTAKKKRIIGEEKVQPNPGSRFPFRKKRRPPETTNKNWSTMYKYRI